MKNLPTEPQEMLTVAEAAVFMRVSQKTVYAWVEEERIPHLRAGRRILFERSDLMNWLRGQKGDGNAPKAK